MVIRRRTNDANVSLPVQLYDLPDGWHFNPLPQSTPLQESGIEKHLTFKNFRNLQQLERILIIDWAAAKSLSVSTGKRKTKGKGSGLWLWSCANNIFSSYWVREILKLQMTENSLYYVERWSFTRCENDWSFFQSLAKHHMWENFCISIYH